MKEVIWVSLYLNVKRKGEVSHNCSSKQKLGIDLKPGLELYC